MTQLNPQTLTFSAATMDRDKLTIFIKAAEVGLASVRSSLLISAQNGDISDALIARHDLSRLRSDAEKLSLTDVCERFTAAINSVTQISASPDSAQNKIFTALDNVSEIEALLFDIPIHSDEFASDAAALIDSSFDDVFVAPTRDEETEEFEIDEESLEIFRCEADELIANITHNLSQLKASPADQAALWEIRRNSHTLKGAAGIIGLTEASKSAHRVEDLLDKLVEMRRDAAPPVIDFLEGSLAQLKAIVSAKPFEGGRILDANYRAALDIASSPAESDAAVATSTASDSSSLKPNDLVKATTTPIVRVSLDRLDELIKLSQGMLFNRSALAERFEELCLHGRVDAESLIKLESLIETQRHLTDEIQAKLLKIRMVRFGTLETRLSRTINVTCTDENKKAFLELHNADIEIDTQLIDALIEPLLHLLKNAVVHGIEAPETRRLIGKPERGAIGVRLDADEETLVLSVTDDGNGISPERLRAKAISLGIIDEEKARSMSDDDAMQLIFDRGLTTAQKLDMNAGRGVGMSIVKEAVEERGGSVNVESRTGVGTVFSITMPLTLAKSVATPQPAPEPEAEPESALPPLVFVVDDSATIRRQTTKMIEGAGLRVITANNGAEALELLLNGDWEPDLILSDIEMPQIDGWEFLEYVKTDENFGHIPMIMITSLDSETNRTRALAVGAEAYLIKPFDISALEHVVSRVASQPELTAAADGSV